jgi:hypothetical protein
MTDLLPVAGGEDDEAAEAGRTGCQSMSTLQACGHGQELQNALGLDRLAFTALGDLLPAAAPLAALVPVPLDLAPAVDALGPGHHFDDALGRLVGRWVVVLGDEGQEPGPLAVRSAAGDVEVASTPARKAITWPRRMTIR